MLSKNFLESQIKKLNERLTLLHTKLEIVSTCKFSVGQVAHHKEYGNVLITDIRIRGKCVVYLVQSTKGEQVVAESYLIPFTPNTNTLYG